MYFNDINEKGNQNKPQYPVQKKINYRTNRILVNPCQVSSNYYFICIIIIY